MSVCDFEKYFADYITGELKNSEKLSFHAHLDNCATCPERLDEFYTLHNELKLRKRKDAPSEILIKYHNNLASEFANVPDKEPLAGFISSILHSIFWDRSYSFKIAEVVGLILIGVLIGWLIFYPASNIQNSNNSNAEYFPRPISKAEVEYINYYFQAAEFLLLELKNINADEPLNSVEFEFKKDIAQKLLIKTFIIHEVALRQNDPKILRFLSKMELLLYEVSNIPSEELSQSVESFNLIIDDSRLLDDARKFQKDLIKYQASARNFESLLEEGKEK